MVLKQSGQLLNGLAGFKTVWTALKWAAGFKLVLNIYITEKSENELVRASLSKPVCRTLRI